MQLLLKLYKQVCLAIMDYCAIVFHSISPQAIQTLARFQCIALQLITGC
jgi:hypothetical protein